MLEDLLIYVIDALPSLHTLVIAAGIMGIGCAISLAIAYLMSLKDKEDSCVQD